MRPKHSVTGAAAENEIAAGRKNAAPVVRIEFTGPDFFAGVHVPGLNFADMIQLLLAPSFECERPCTRFRACRSLLAPRSRRSGYRWPVCKSPLSGL